MEKMSNDKIAIIAFSAIIVCGILVATIGNFGAKVENKNTTKNTVVKNTTITKTADEDINYEANAIKQMAEPNEGEEIAIFHVANYGDIKVKFFKEVAPKAVENFITHAKNGYYNGLTFHRVINEFMIQGGDPKGNGTGGESIWGKDFGEELNKSVVPYRGALCMASKGTGTNSIGSQFFIVQANYKEAMEPTMTTKYSKDLINQYKKYGGDITDLYMKYTIFGQVISGMDIVDNIAKTEIDSNDKPVKDVVITSIDVTTYTK